MQANLLQGWSYADTLKMSNLDYGLQNVIMRPVASSLPYDTPQSPFKSNSGIRDDSTAQGPSLMSLEHKKASSSAPPGKKKKKKLALKKNIYENQPLAEDEDGEVQAYKFTRP